MRKGPSVAESFVGRTGELGEVMTAGRAAEEGSGSLIVVTGKPGIGKTRLCQEVVVRARRQGRTVVMARCWHEGGAPPYWPWQPILRELCGQDAADLLAMEGELPTDERDRFARFSAVTDALAEATRHRGACLIIDDVHAADVASLLLTRFVARNLHRFGLALVLSRRSSEPAGHLVESQLLDEIEQEAALLPLARFNLTESATFLRSHGVNRVEDDLLRLLVRVTDGNPLYLRRIAVVGAHTIEQAEPRGQDQGPVVAQGVRTAVQQAFARLSPPIRETLQISSVLGASPSFSEAAAVAGVDTPQVLEAVHQAATVGLVVDDETNRFTFSHDLVRAALEETLDLRQRLDAHARAAKVFGGDSHTSAADRLTRAAHHALYAAPRSSADARAAVEACRAAGRALVRNLAYEQADRLLSSATELYEQAGLGPQPAQLLIEWAQAALLCGWLTEARTRFEWAVKAAEQEGDPVLFAEATLGLGGYWLTESRGAARQSRILALQRAGLAALPEEHSALRARLTVRLAAEAVYNGGPPEPMHEALEVARRCGDQLALADALSLCHHALLGPEHARTRLALADELVTVGSEAGHGVLGLMGLCWRTLDLFWLGDEGAIRALEDLRQRADALACKIFLYIVNLLDVTLAIRAGRLAEVEALAQACYKLGTEVGDSDAFAYLGAQLSIVRWLQGRGGEMAEMADSIARSPALHEGEFAFRASAGVFAAQAGQPERAREILDQLLAVGLDELPTSSTWLAGMMAIVELAVGLEDPDAARQAYDLLLPFADLPILPSLGAVCFGSTQRPLGLAAGVFGDRRLAVEHLEQAIAANRRLGNRPLMTLSQANLATALQATGGAEDAARAANLLTSAAAAADTMEMSQLAAEWRAQHDELASSLSARGGRRPAPAAAAAVAPEMTAPPGAAEASADPPRPDMEREGLVRQGVIRRQGSGWFMAIDQRHVFVGNLIGMSYLVELLTHPGEAIPAIVLAGQGQELDVYSRQELLDDAARAAYTRRARELGVELEQAEADADIGRAEKLRTELDALIDQVQASMGLDSRPRLFAGPAERARTAVRKAIVRAVEAISEGDEVIGELLRSSITTGATCVYTPDPRRPMRWITRQRA